MKSLFSNPFAWCLLLACLLIVGCGEESEDATDVSNATSNATSNGTTATDGTCSSNADCAGGQLCGEGTCREVCVAGTPCAVPGTVCSPELGYCVDRECTTAADCNSGFVCMGGFCIEDDNAPVVCDPECGDGELCEEGVCIVDPDFVPPCDPECGAEERCEFDAASMESRCVPDVAVRCAQVGELCDETTEETETLLCTQVDNRDLARSTCQAACEDNEDCSTGTFCARLGTERPFVCLPSNCGSFFTSVEDCGDVGDNGGNCVEYANETLFCEPTGGGAVGDTCEAGSTTCGPGLVCADEACEQPCQLDGDGCPSGTACIDLLTIPNAGVCRTSCDGFDDEGSCPDGFGCLPAGSTDDGYCVPAGDTPEGDVCEDAPDSCVPGTLCRRFRATDERRCLPLCDRTAENFGDDTCAGEMDVCGNVNGVAGTCFQGCTPYAEVTGCEAEGTLFCLPFEDGSRGTCFASGEAATTEACNLVDGSFLGVCDAANVCVPDDFEDDASPGTCFSSCDRSADDLGDATCPGESDVCVGFANLVGYCDAGCTPFVGADNGCEEDGIGFCFPLERHDRGRCFENGATPVGGDCEFGEGNSFLGECDPDGVCVPNNFNDLEEGGVCGATCPTFSSVSDYEGTCAEDEICDFFTALDWGVCTTEVLDERLEPFATCPEAGKYCDEDVMCIQVDNDGSNLCIPFCRLERGDDDCPTDTGMDDLICDQVFSGDTLGACVPAP